MPLAIMEWTNTMTILQNYKNGNYVVTLFSDGTKVRRTEEEQFNPAFAESIDCKITDHCDGGCPMCYENCTPTGKHGDILNAKFIDSLHAGTEIAVNGNDLTHPHLVTFLKKIKDRGVIVNLTVNQLHFERHYNMIKALIDEHLIWGLGVSLREPTDYFIEHIKSIPNAVIHTIVGVISKEDIAQLADKDLKILILGFKTTGRGTGYINDNLEFVLKNFAWIYLNIETIIKQFKCVCFDNLAIRQLEVERFMSKEEWDKFYMGDDGSFTFYVDLVNNIFSKDSVTAKEKCFPINNRTIDEMFEVIKNTTWDDI